MYKCTDWSSVCISLSESHSEWEYWQVELDHLDTKIEKQISCTYLEGGVGHTVHFPQNCTSSPICLLLGRSSARGPAVFSVRCRADEKATTEGWWMQLEALGEEVKQSLGACWMAEWNCQVAAHFPLPKRRSREIFFFFRNIYGSSSKKCFFTCLKINLCAAVTQGAKNKITTIENNYIKCNQLN